MTGRDRMVAIVVATLAVLGAAWFIVVSPERQKASKLSSQVAEAQAQLTSAEGQLANARSAESQYSAAYAAIVSLGKAVPASQEVPSLIYQLEQASNRKQVTFQSIVAGGGTGASSASASSAGAAAAAAATPAGFTQMPFTFVFNGSYFDLEHLFDQLNRFTLQNSSGGLQVSGRLLTIQSVKLAPLGTSTTGGGAVTQLNGTITATAYVLPASQGLTGAATATSPLGSAASSTGAPTSPTAPAIARVTP
jgi:hypothetical protein